jgi:hypothetical protein
MLTVSALRIYLGIDPASTVDEQAMTFAVDAANDQVITDRPDITLDPGTGAVLPTWPARVEQASKIEGSRLYGRRGSIQGVAAFADVAVSYVPGTDPDYQMLMQIGRYQPPVVA